MADQALLEARVEGGVAHLTLNRPEQRNALSASLAAQLEAALRRADADPGVRAILLSGRGPSFCAGADIAEFATLPTDDGAELHRVGTASNGLFRLGAELRTPLVVAVHGHAMGGGVGLVAMGHLALAADDAVFALSEIKVGLFPFAIFPSVARALGSRRALAWALTGETWTAGEARQAGLVHEVVPAAELPGAAEQVARELAGRNPVAVAGGLQAYHAVAEMPYAQAIDYFTLLRGVTYQSEDFRQGVAAFLRRRSPARQEGDQG